MQTLKQKVGQKLMIGIPHAEATDGLIQHLREIRPGGLIIFRRNFKNALQFRKLISEIDNALGRRLILAVDHEGGRVIHLSEGITVFPDNWAVGNTGNPDFAAKQGAMEAKELRRLGFDLNLAPTVDVLGEQFSPNIGIRSYGKDPEKVSHFSARRIQAMQEAGLSACAKHFPGQGQSSWDAHLELPVLDTSEMEIRGRHLLPFISAIQGGVDSMMSSHPVYPALDKSNQPTTFSRKIIHDLLRKELNFHGLILSDDLEMGALRKECSLEDSAVKAISAGHDMILICSDLTAQKKAYQSLINAYQDKRLDCSELEKSVERIAAFQTKRRMRFEEGEAIPEADGAGLAQEIANQGIEAALSSPNDASCHPRTGLGGDPLNLGPRLKHSGTTKNVDSRLKSCRADRPVPEDQAAVRRLTNRCGNDKRVLVIFPRLSELSEKIYIEDEIKNPKSFFQQQFGKEVTVFTLGLTPSPKEIEQSLSLAGSSAITLFFCYDARLDSQTKTLLNKLQGNAKQLVVFLMRDPYDRELLKEGIPYWVLFGFRCCQIRASLNLLNRVGCQPTRLRRN